MSMASISRSAFSRTGTILTMKPGVTTLSVGTIDVTGITIDDDYSIDVSSDELTFTNGSGTRTISFIEDIISGGVIKPELMPDRALTQIYKPLNETLLLGLDPIQIGDIAIKILFKSLSKLLYLNFLIINFSCNKIGDIASKYL